MCLIAMKISIKLGFELQLLVPQFSFTYHDNNNTKKKVY